MDKKERSQVNNVAPEMNPNKAAQKNSKNEEMIAKEYTEVTDLFDDEYDQSDR